MTGEKTRPSGSLRLFAGVELDADVKARAASVADRLRGQMDAMRPRPDLRWVPPENFHITLWFIGNVDEARAAEIRSAIERPYATPAFDLPVTGCGAFPRSGPPRVVWIGTQAAAAMGSLYDEVRDRLVPLGFEEERRPYSAHLTIARVRDPGGRALPRRSDAKAGRSDAKAGRSDAKAGALREMLARTPGACGVSRVTAVTLFRSRLSPKGAVYEPLVRVPLS